ncbi:hypothetical protein RD792_016250 [Penstemon davidsonii]|uniref:Alpha/beta hydrolase fold-3 domain-containing protein n=1 Tax=Penstemon davidsonii TaxID=160366 RepID=A0ABR0CIR8_9LAMI|nr:hypothetical protein RD792_016250 [Penstemon davidsonii]
MLSSKIFSTFTLLFIFIHHSHSSTNSTETILYDIFPFVRVYTNGRIQRFFGQDFVPASTDPITKVQSKDVKISKELNISARFYLPENANPGRKLPLLIYFHGGGFLTESAFSPTYHNFLNSLVAKSKVIAVSVNYRLAPEFPLPIAYEDSWLVVKWVFSHFKGNGNEMWLKKYADFRRVYLAGDSAGGNIAHHMGVRVGLENLDPGINIDGLFLNCPFFWGKRAIGNETENPFGANLIERIWVHAYPKSSGLDDPLLNPGMDPGLRMLRCKRVLVYAAETDVLRFRDLYYEKELKRSGWNGVVNVVEVKGEGHVFNLNNPTNPKSIAMLKKIAVFLKY